MSHTYTKPNIDITETNDPDVLYDQYKAALADRCRATINDLIETGKILNSARDRLQHGHFGRLLREMGIERSRAASLMTIAGNPAICSNLLHLPPHWTVLEELAKVQPKRLEKLVEAGQVTPESRRKDVIVFLPKEQCASTGCNKLVHKDGYCDEHYVAPQPLSAHDLIIPVLERHKDELKAKPDQSRMLVDWLVENVEEGQREVLFADLLPVDQGSDDSSSTKLDGTVIIQQAPTPRAAAAAEPSPKARFENPEDEPVPPLVPALG